MSRQRGFEHVVQEAMEERAAATRRLEPIAIVPERSRLHTQLIATVVFAIAFLCALITFFMFTSMAIDSSAELQTTRIPVAPASGTAGTPEFRQAPATIPEEPTPRETVAAPRPSPSQEEAPPSEPVRIQRPGPNAGDLTG